MHSRLVKFSLLSLAFHALGFAVLQYDRAFDGAAPGVPNRAVASVTSADIVPADSVRSATSSQEKPEHPKPLLNAHGDSTAAADSHATEAAPLSAATPAGQDYFAAGELTRLPVPVTAIDLDVAEIKEVAVGEALSLTILIDEEGKVVEVSSASEDEASRIFSERVAAIFKRARFAPGEVNGKAVKARVEISVVSEHTRAL